MAGVFADFERSIIVERTRAGLERARARGKRLGRPITPDHVTTRVLELRRAGMGMDRIARELGIGKSVAQRICQAMAEAAKPFCPAAMVPLSSAPTAQSGGFLNAVGPLSPSDPP
jgi:DNA invertase Pin-like site-specific DNA recombinase